MDSLKNIVTGLLDSAGHFTNPNEASLTALNLANVDLR